MPFLSSDLMRCAAGLTPLKTWRFSVATLLGIIPASFLLAHFGEALVAGNMRALGVTGLALGAVTLLPVVWKITTTSIRELMKHIVQTR